MTGQLRMEPLGLDLALPEEPIAPATPSLIISVHGQPIPQGSMRAFKNKHSGRVIVTADNARTKPWKAAITDKAADVVAAAGMPNPAYGREPVRIAVTFRMPRPKGHYGAKGLLPSAPRHPTTIPDLDKLVRAVLDALTGIVYRDDAQVVALETYKRYADELVTTIEVGLAR